MYDSLQEFIPHIEWLLTDTLHDSRNCKCRFCTQLNNEERIIQDRDLASTNDSVDEDMDMDNEEPQCLQEIDFVSKIPELKNFILQSEKINSRLEQVLLDAQDVMIKLRFENKYVINCEI